MSHATRLALHDLAMSHDTLDALDDIAIDALDLAVSFDVDAIDASTVDCVAYFDATAFAVLDDEIEASDRW